MNDTNGAINLDRDIDQLASDGRCLLASKGPLTLFQQLIDGRQLFRWMVDLVLCAPWFLAANNDIVLVHL